METVIRKNRKATKRIKAVWPWLLPGLLLAVFWGMFAVYGPGIYNDSDQYIKMHIHREPLYPLFLAALRGIFGEGWLTAMGILQNGLAAVSIWVFARYMAGRFRLNWLEEGILALLGLMPHMMTMFFSSLHLFLTNSVMSEALCLPLFLLFMTACFGMCLEEERKKRREMAGLALALAFLLSLTRSQMLLAVLLWTAVLGGRILLEKKEKGQGAGARLPALLAVLTAALLVFALRTLSVRTYNLVFNGRFINNTYGAVNTLTNILYAADRSHGERISDPEAREFFYLMYDLTEERQANYKYAGKGWTRRAEHLEQWHDTIKYEMIEDVFYQAYDKTVTTDYIEQNLMADETAARIIAGILPGCFVRWLGNYLAVAAYGLIRSIAVVHPLLNRAVALIYLSVPLLAWLVRRRGGERGAIVVMAIALLAVLANAAAVSVTIMCLSRYMIYGFTTFYAGYFLLLREIRKSYWRRRAPSEKGGRS